jgi:hypothetical protein
MNRTKLTIVFILFLIGASVIPTTAQKDMTVSSSSSTQNSTTALSSSAILWGGFGLHSVLYFSWDANGTQHPLPPGGPPRNVNLTISYLTVLGSLYVGKLILLYCRATQQSVTVTLEIGEIPTWCTASLSKTKLQFPVTGNVEEQTVTLTVAVDEHAPAYALGYVRIHASVNTLYGPFGLLPFVNGFDQTFTMCFFPGYLPHIIVVPASNHLNVTPGNTSYLPINITNHGNARTVVFTEIVEGLPGSWITYIPGQVTLEVNMSSEIVLSVVPPVDFNGTESITLSFTPYKADDYSQHGDPVYVTIEIICEP